MKDYFERVRASLKVQAPLDPEFVPAALFMKQIEQQALKEGAESVALAIEGAGGAVKRFETVCFRDEAAYGELNKFYIERVVKSLIWIYGGFKVTVGAPLYIGQAVATQYAAGGAREFDADFIRTVYERPLEIIPAAVEDVPESRGLSQPAGRHLDGCRLGFDAGGSDIKISAVVDGKAIFSEEIVWHPKTQSDPEYHFKHIVDVMKRGASHMPRVDAVGISSAGVYIGNRTMVASLFMKVPAEDFNAKVKDIYLRAVRELGEGIPVQVANDGDVTALAGAMDLNDGNVLGIAMGTSEAGGFVDGGGNITGWLNELAFVPCDFAPGAALDEWSGDRGCGVKYFSQDSVAKLAPAAGIRFEEQMTPAEKLKHVQELMGQKPETAGIFKTIGVYLGYTLAYYAKFYALRHVLILGRVTSGAGGQIILDCAEEVLKAEFPDLSVKLHLPDESDRRVGQSIAAASLPEIPRG